MSWSELCLIAAGEVLLAATFVLGVAVGVRLSEITDGFGTEAEDNEDERRSDGA